ncbi:hypothetical protein ACFYZU_14105 [Streptomyces sp. NPDC001651]|uniref:hypothetical protein n=1 Tax=unclassified Streptomyces TaxID=2593676 RepID=UPI0036C2D216
MNDDEKRQAAHDEREFEEELRELLAEDAYTIRPSAAPYPRIRRRGALERRRRVAVAGAALATLAAVPAAVYALGAGSAQGSTAAAPKPSASASASPGASSTPSAEPDRATAALFDGITYRQAREGLENCLDSEFTRDRPGGPGLAPPDTYAIVLAMRSTGDSNTGGDGVFVVAQADDEERSSLICRLEDGVTQGITGFTDDSEDIPDAGAVLVNPNGNRLFKQTVLDHGRWRLPFRWAVIGTAEPSVARVTVSYGDSSAEVTVHDGRFVASGVLNEQVTRAPHIKGYDAGGELVYDSDDDKYWDKAL